MHCKTEWWRCRENCLSFTARTAQAVLPSASTCPNVRVGGPHSKRCRDLLLAHHAGWQVAGCKPACPVQWVVSSRAADMARPAIPYAPGCELRPGTRLRTAAHVKYPTRYPPAYAHSRSNGGTPFSYVGDEVRRAMHRPITRPQTPLAAVCEYLRSHSRLHPHGHYPGFASPSCPVPMRRVSSPWQSSGRRSVSEQPLRHDGDRRTA